jgi:hypothetical protein
MATAVKTSEIEKAEVKEESVSHLLQGDHVASKGLQLSTSWSYTQVPRQQQQGASSEDNKEDKRRQETVRGLLSSFPSSRPLEHSTTTKPSISPESFLLTSLLMTSKLVMQAFKDLSLKLNKIEVVYFSLDCGDGLGSSCKDGNCSLYSKMARTNLRLQG